MTDEEEGRPGWRDRLRAWWHGEAQGFGPEVQDFRTSTADEPAPEESPPVDETPSIATWSPRRQQIVQLLFGEGIHQPGTEAQIRALTAPLGLNPNMSVTELGCGMGGMTRLLARDGIWVDAYEPDQELSEAALALARREGIKQRTNIKHALLDDIQFKRRSLDAVLSKEGLMSVQDKRLLLSKLRAAMKPGGQLMFTDFLLTGPEGSRVYEVWMDREPVKPTLLTPDDLQAELESLGFTILLIEDVTEEYKAGVIDAFAKYAADIKLRGSSVEDSEREWVICEGEHWAIRISAMDAHIIRLFRCFCRVLD
jgi:SAM-dependent methyltransferase